MQASTDPLLFGTIVGNLSDRIYIKPASSWKCLTSK